MHPVLIALFAVDLIGTLLGIWAMRSGLCSGRSTAFGAGIMVGVALFWILPDMTRDSSIAHSVLTVGAAIGFLYAFDRYVYPVCPCCAHRDHGHHKGCSNEQGLRTLAPLVTLAIAMFVHNLFDGWTAALAVFAGGKLQSGIAAGLLAHKLPEAIIFGLILREVSRYPALTIISAGTTSVAILFGAAVHRGLWMLFGETVLAASLSLACGSFLFIGFHALLKQRQQCGMWSALKPLVFGLLVSALLERFVSTALAQTR